MGNVENIEQQVKGLSAQELASFRDWFAAFDAEAWDTQIKTDVSAGKLDGLAEKALQAHASGKSSQF